MCVGLTSIRSLCSQLPEISASPILSGLNCGRCPRPLAQQSMTFNGVLSTLSGLNFPHCSWMMQTQHDRLWKVCSGAWLPSV